jgi:hypothetical protein
MEMLLGPALLFVPVVGPMVVLGPRATMMFSGLQRAVVVGGISALAGALTAEVFHRFPGGEPLRGPDPQRQSYDSFVSFSDPAGNAWIVQEVIVRLVGRVAKHQTQPVPT